ncbi:hypothetical protein [Microcella frigidaquae]|uniref:Uncharacterized protein n=1 Tax=Microcella frigidaquae TaxID=424758 RepID=A0A840XPM0_9MICO|nr:hypothetical protein [Microcella frigidaquae]MBB5617869.1 hypothetical protein [Microcella frigidaquae]NHN44417.1 hypothetical protein [Microcella frigidaquae]
MAENWTSALLPIITLVLGAVLTFLAESIRHRTERRERLQDALTARRADAATAFIDAAHESAHLLGRMTPGCPNPLPLDEDKYWLIDSAVAARLNDLALVASSPSLAAARALHGALQGFRASVMSGITYGSNEYWSAYAPVRAARTAFIDASRADIVG